MRNFIISEEEKRRILTILVVPNQNATIERHSYRALLKEIKLLKKISSSAVCRRCMEFLGIECDSLIPWGRLARSRSALLVKYAQDRKLVILRRH